MANAIDTALQDSQRRNRVITQQARKLLLTRLEQDAEWWYAQWKELAERGSEADKTRAAMVRLAVTRILPEVKETEAAVNTTAPTMGMIVFQNTGQRGTLAGRNTALAWREQQRIGQHNGETGGISAVGDGEDLSADDLG